MFAGIVEDAGRVLSLEERTEAWLLKLTLPFADGDGLEAGSSLSVNGCCLTLRKTVTVRKPPSTYWRKPWNVELERRDRRQFGQPGTICLRTGAWADIL